MWLSAIGRKETSAPLCVPAAASAAAAGCGAKIPLLRSRDEARLLCADATELARRLLCKLRSIHGAVPKREVASQRTAALERVLLTPAEDDRSREWASREKSSMSVMSLSAADALRCRGDGLNEEGLADVKRWSDGRCPACGSDSLARQWAWCHSSTSVCVATGAGGAAFSTPASGVAAHATEERLRGVELVPDPGDGSGEPQLETTEPEEEEADDRLGEMLGARTIVRILRGGNGAPRSGVRSTAVRCGDAVEA